MFCKEIISEATPAVNTLTEDDQIIDRIVDDLQNHPRYIDSALDQITYAVFREKALVDKHKRLLIDEINKRKSEILKHLLTCIKTLPTGNMLYVVSPAVRALTMLGIDWPELVIIKKSIDTERAQTDDDVLEQLNYDNLEENIWLENQRGFDPDRYESTINKFDQFIKVGEFIKALEFLRDKFKFSNLPKQAVDYILTEYKHDIIKYILTLIKMENIPLAYSVSNRLKDLDCKWTEVDTVLNSIEHLNLNEIKENINQKNKLGNINKKIKVKEAGSSYGNLLDRFHGPGLIKDYIIKVLKLNPNSPDAKKILSVDNNSDEFKKLVNRYKLEMLDDLNKLKIGLSVVHLRISTISLLLFLGFDWPELKIIIENNKTNIIKLLLKNLIDRSFIVKSILYLLKRLNVNWPELEIIMKSMKAEGLLEQNKKLTSADPVERWIAVFKASTHPKFAGKTPEQREKMARAAQYRAVQNKNEFKRVNESLKPINKVIKYGIMPDGPLEISKHFVDRMHERGLSNTVMSELITKAVRQYKDKIAGLGSESFVVRFRTQPAALAIAKVQQIDDSYKYVLTTFHPELRSGYIQQVFEV